MARSWKNQIDSQFTSVGDMGSVYGGAVVDKPVSVKEALELAGLNWTVETKGLCTSTHERIKIPGWFATIRSDTKTALGVVKSRYEPLQNADAFAWVDDLLGGSAGSACITSAGALHQGRLTWISVDLGGFEIVPGDEVRKHLLLLNSHDGQSNFTIHLLPTRLACCNMLNFYKNGGRSNPFSIRHTDGAKIRLSEVEKAIAMSYQNFGAAQKAFRDMQKTRISEQDQRRLVFHCLLGDQSEKLLTTLDDGKYDKAPTWVMHEKMIGHIIENGPGAEFGRGNVWGTFNGVNGFFDHIRNFRTTGEKGLKISGLTESMTEAVEGRDKDIALESKLVGHSSKMKIQAFETCLDYCKNKN